MKTPAARSLIEAFGKADLLDLITPINAWIAIVQSKTKGTLIYAAWTEDELIDKVALYCRKNWLDWFDNYRQPHGDNRSAIKTYFAHANTLVFWGAVEMDAHPDNDQIMVIAIEHEGKTYAFAGTYSGVQASAAAWCMRQLKRSHPGTYWSTTLTDRGVVELFFRTFRNSSTIAYNDCAKL